MCLQKLGLRKNLPENCSLSELERDIQELKANLNKRKLARVLKILLIGFLLNRDTERRIIQLTAKIQNKISSNVSEVAKMIYGIKGSGTYLIYPKKADCISRIERAEADMSTCETTNVLSHAFTEKMRRRLNDIKMFVMNYNPEFVKQRKRDYKYLWSKDLISLDDEQQTAIVTDDKYNLVAAAAGSGKTEVLITRIAYLIQRKPDGVDPKRILAIAYQRKARAQIEQRLLNRYGIGDVCARTFHKLGKDILEHSGKTILKTDIIDENRKYEFVKSFFEEEVHTNQAFYQLFIRYIVTIHDKD